MAMMIWRGGIDIVVVAEEVVRCLVMFTDGSLGRFGSSCYVSVLFCRHTSTGCNRRIETQRRRPRRATAHAHPTLLFTTARR